jgi:hypothetical protein
MSKDCRKGYKCPSGKICNPGSGRCVNMGGTIGKKLVNNQPVLVVTQKIGDKQCKTPCSADKICNPKTGRCVSRTGSIGKNLIPGNNKQSSHEKVEEKSGKRDLCSDQKCPSDKVCNPKTGKCVLRHGKVGREITKNLKQKPENSSRVINHVDYITGPISLSHVYSGKYRKNIYLFGDMHKMVSKCPTSVTGKTVKHITAFIADTILLNRNKTIDIYLEQSFISDKYPVRPGLQNSYLTQVNESLDSCMQIRKHMCKYPNVRVHYVNVRKTIPKVKVLNDVWHYARMLSLGEATVPPKDVDDIFPIDTNELLSLTKIDKQLNAIRDPLVREYFTAYISNKMFGFLPAVVDWINIRDHTRQSDSSATRIINFLNVLMDAYLLTRMFRSYSRSREGKSSTDSMFNIIYAGEAHISNYLKVFSDLEFLVGPSSQSRQLNVDMQCLNVSNRSQPFFHHVPSSPNAEHALVDSFGKHALSMIPDGYRIVSEIGKGISGHAYLVSDQYFNQVILKFVKTEKTIAGTHKGIKHEFAMQRKFADFGLAPRPISLHFYHPRPNRTEEVAVMSMDRVYGTIGYLIDNVILDQEMIDQIVEQIEAVLKKMCKEGLVHGDFHPWNLGFNFTNNGGIRIIPIDMAYSCCILTNVPCRPDFELKKLLQVLFHYSDQNKERIAKANCTALLGRIQDLMLNVFNMSQKEIGKNAADAKSLALEQHRKYQDGALKLDIGGWRV